MKTIEDKEMSSLEIIAIQFLATARPIAITEDVFVNSMIYQTNYAFADRQDAVIYAAIISDLLQQDFGELKCFISRDNEAFNNPNVKSELLDYYNCRYIGRFEHALSFIQNNLP